MRVSASSSESCLGAFRLCGTSFSTDFCFSLEDTLGDSTCAVSESDFDCAFDARRRRCGGEVGAELSPLEPSFCFDFSASFFFFAPREAARSDGPVPAADAGLSFFSTRSPRSLLRSCFPFDSCFRARDGGGASSASLLSSRFMILRTLDGE